MDTFTRSIVEPQTLLEREAALLPGFSEGGPSASVIQETLIGSAQPQHHILYYLRPYFLPLREMFAPQHCDNLHQGAEADIATDLSVVVTLLFHALIPDCPCSVNGFGQVFVVFAAGIQDRDGAKLLLQDIKACFPRLELSWADGGYRGHLIGWVREVCGWLHEIVKRPDHQVGFSVLPRR